MKKRSSIFDVAIFVAIVSMVTALSTHTVLAIDSISPQKGLAVWQYDYEFKADSGISKWISFAASSIVLESEKSKLVTYEYDYTGWYS